MNVITKPLLQSGGLLLRGGLHRHVPTTALLASNLFSGYKKQNQIPLLNPTINNNHGYSSTGASWSIKPLLCGLAGLQLLSNNDRNNNVAHCMDNDRPSKRVKSDSAQTQALTVEGNNFFKTYVTRGQDGKLPPLPSGIDHRSSLRTKLSNDSRELGSAKALLEKAKKDGYTKNHPFCPIASLSMDPENRATCMVVSGWPPDDDFQGLDVHGLLSTRIMTSVEEDGTGRYESLDTTSQNPSVHGFATTRDRIIGRVCDITEERASFVANESFVWTDVHPFLRPYDSGDPTNTDYDELVMQYFIEILEHETLLPNIQCLVILGAYPWEFMTVKFPEKFPDKYERLIKPKIIQHCPVMHPTVICKFFPTPRQGYTYTELMSNVTKLLRDGSEDFRDSLIPWKLAGRIFPYAKTRNDNREGDDHYVYIGRYEDFDGDDDTVFVGYNYTQFRQLMYGDDGEGIDISTILNQKELNKKGSHKLKSIGLTLEIIHFMDYYESRGKQMERDDWGVQNRKGAHMAWKKYVNDKRGGEDEETKEEMQGGLEAVMAAAALKKKSS